jgi:hypothetical protein
MKNRKKLSIPVSFQETHSKKEENTSKKPKNKKKNLATSRLCETIKARNEEIRLKSFVEKV